MKHRIFALFITTTAAYHACSVAKADTPFVLTSTHGIFTVDAAGQPYPFIPSLKEDYLSSSLLLDGKGRLLVGNYYGVDAYTPDGEFVSQLFSFAGDDNHHPMAITEDGVIYAADQNRLLRYDTRSSNAPETFVNLFTDTVQDIAIGPNGDIFVLSVKKEEASIVQYDATTGLGVAGRFLLDDGDPFNWPSGLALDDDGCIYIGDLNTSAIRRYSPDMHSFSRLVPGEEYGLQQPIAIQVGTDGNLYVMDAINSQVMMYSMYGQFLGIAADIEGYFFDRGLEGTYKAVDFVLLPDRGNPPVTPVPEPSTYALAGAAVLCVAAWRRRSRKQP